MVIFVSEFDLKNCDIRTDLIVESIGANRIDGIIKSERNYDKINVNDIVVTHDISSLHKRKGKYITISFDC